MSATTTNLSKSREFVGKAVNELGEIPLHTLLVFLLVAEADVKGEQREVAELGKASGLSSASISRNLAALGEWHRLQRPGLGLVELIVDLRDRRRKFTRLTPKGRTLVAKLTK